MAVGLALMGARGQTATEISTGLKLSAGQSTADVADSFSQILAPLQGNQMLKIANKVYAMKRYHLSGDFAAVATKKFYSEADTLNFANADESAAIINDWVESKTNHLIKNLISSDALSSDTRLVLVNAIYFKGQWLKKFPVDDTQKEPFYTSETESKLVDMMHVKAHFRYGVVPDLDATLIELPYQNSDMSMLIVLPNSRTGLAAVEAKLKTIDLNAVIQTNMYSTEVNVALPKFKIEYEVKLPDVLKKVSSLSLVRFFGKILRDFFWSAFHSDGHDDNVYGFGRFQWTVAGERTAQDL